MTAKIVVFANYKGGVGKTTAAVAFASELGRRGSKVILADLDIQASATIIATSAQTAEARMPFQVRHLAAVVKTNPKSLSQLVKEMSAECDFLIIDTPGTFESEGTQIAVVMSDLIVAPTSNSALDYRSTRQAMETFGHLAMRRPDLAVCILKMRVERTAVSKAIDSALDHLAVSDEYDIKPKILKTVIRKSVGFAESGLTGTPVWMLGRSSAKANEDAVNFTSEVLELMGVEQGVPA